MSHTTLISARELLEHLDDPDWAILDCRFLLNDAAYGRREYQQAHIPGAVYVHLEEDLCAPVEPGRTGRHPLASLDQLVENFSRWGVDQRVQVVLYDDYPAGTAGIAARGWWTLRYLGHTAAAVLDGGWLGWKSAGYPWRGGVEARSRRAFTPEVHPELLASAEDVERLRHHPAWRVFDSRSPDRYRGENETIDPVAGHIPGAFSAPYVENMNADGIFLPADALRQRFTSLLQGAPAERAIFYCGSGVTACQNLLALAHAGLDGARLYLGSWSEWITDPRRPVAIGADRG